MKAGLRTLGRVRAALETLADVHSLEEFPGAALRCLAQAVEAKSYTYNEMDLAREVVHASIWPEDAAPPAADQIYAAHMWDHPVLCHFAATGNPRPHAISEFLSPRRFHSTRLYSALYKEIGYEDQAGFFLSAPRRCAIALAVGREAVFTPDELALLDVLRLQLDTLRRALIAEAALAERTRLAILLKEKKIARLSRRQQEVLSWMSEGKTNPEIGLILGISSNTVRNHVAAILERLRVENRLGAALMVQRPHLQ